MQRRRLVGLAGLVAFAAGAVPALAAAQPVVAPTEMMVDPDGASILARATEAHGGEGWARVKTLVLHGRVVFWGPTGAAPRSTAEQYSMWRVFDAGRSAAHGAEGKVRIVARNEQKLVFTVGYDGATTWTEKGITPPAEADAFWASNFGFGIIRQALKPGFKAERVADGWSQGHPVYLVKLTDPQGGVSLFGIDRKSFAVRSIGFTTPRGWHERHYDDFVKQDNPAWLQAREVTLYYNGVKANTVFWQRWSIDGPIDDAVFAPPAAFPPPAVVR
jgi:hypothetical protein